VWNLGLGASRCGQSKNVIESPHRYGSAQAYFSDATLPDSICGVIPPRA
jgi:hypothetical protein